MKGGPGLKKNQTAFLKLCLADALVSLMKERPYAEIDVSEVCGRSGVGRTTFYRLCGGKGCMDALLLFKLEYEWERYALSHGEELCSDFGCSLLRCVYDSRELVRLMYENGLEDALRRAFERLTAGAEPPDRESGYLASFFAYGFFGVICRWIQNGFDETPEQVCACLSSALGGVCQKLRAAHVPARNGIQSEREA